MRDKSPFNLWDSLRALTCEMVRCAKAGDFKSLNDIDDGRIRILHSLRSFHNKKENTCGGATLSGCDNRTMLCIEECKNQSNTLMDVMQQELENRRALLMKL